MLWHSIWHSMWHLSWHSIWHSIWHSTWHFFWHSIWPSLMAWVRVQAHSTASWAVWSSSDPGRAHCIAGEEKEAEKAKEVEQEEEKEKELHLYCYNYRETYGFGTWELWNHVIPCTLILGRAAFSLHTHVFMAYFPAVVDNLSFSLFPSRHGEHLELLGEVLEIHDLSDQPLSWLVVWLPSISYFSIHWEFRIIPDDELTKSIFQTGGSTTSHLGIRPLLPVGYVLSGSP